MARENFSLYLRQAQEELSSAVAAPNEEGARRLQSNRAGILGAEDEPTEKPIQGAVSDEVWVEEEHLSAAANLPRLECRLGDGLAVLEEGEVDTVCIAGVGAYFCGQTLLLKCCCAVRCKLVFNVLPRGPT